MEGHLPVLQALLRDPRVDPGERDKVRTQGRGWGCDCRCGGYPSAPSPALQDGRTPLDLART